MSLASDPEIINVRSNHSVDQTVEKLKDILTAQGVSLFALVDHSGEAEKVGLKILPTKLLIFGSRHTADAGCPHLRNRSAAQGVHSGRRRRKRVGFFTTARTI
jgi:hypothetical protein